MGSEARCTARFNGAVSTGTARLETDALQFRGPDLKLTIPYTRVSRLAARDGMLTVSFPDGQASFQLGDAASRWLEKIKTPPSRLQKLGAKPDWRVSAIGRIDQDLLDELEGAVAHLSIGRLLSESDAIFFGASKAEELSRLEALKARLQPNGAIWIVRPKGRPEISEQAVMAAGKAAGLVDVKVVRLSNTHTAEKFVIPLAQRP